MVDGELHNETRSDRVFVSYAFTERNQAVLVAGYLRSRGIDNIYADFERTDIGNDLSPELVRVIEECACCVALLSQDYIECAHCLSELAAFVDRRKPVIPYPDHRGYALDRLRGVPIAESPEELFAAIPAGCKHS
jgi:hypothetical protein